MAQIAICLLGAAFEDQSQNLIAYIQVTVPIFGQLLPRLGLLSGLRIGQILSNACGDASVSLA